MGVIRDNRTKMVPGALISASYVSDVYNVLTGNTVENIAFSGSVNITGSLIADLTGTASFANTASYSIVTTNVVTSSSFADTASFALNVPTPQYLYIDSASGAVTVDFASASMTELNVTGNITLTLTGSETARDYKLLFKNATTTAHTVTWNNQNIFLNGTYVPAATLPVAAGNIEDSTWPLNGVSTGGFSVNNTVYAFSKLANGKYIIAGTFTSISGSSLNRIARLNADGTIDGTFNIGTGFNNNVFRVAEQADEKLVVCGQFTSYSGSSCNYITRINTDGTQDETFNIGTGFNSSFNGATSLDLAIQTDQKILVGGSFTSYSGSSQNRITRINTDGTIDGTFNIGSGFNNTPTTAIKLQSDQKIIIFHNSTTYNGTSVEKIIRLDTDGTIDTTFVTGTISGYTGNDGTLYVEDTDKIIVYSTTSGGMTVSGSSVTPFFRLNSNGSLDSTFTNTDSTLWNPFGNKAYVITKNEAGNILVAGNGFSSTIYRELDATGSLIADYTAAIYSSTVYSLYATGSETVFAAGSIFPNTFSSLTFPRNFVKLISNPNPLRYFNTNVYTNGTRYFIDAQSFIYETDPTIP